MEPEQVHVMASPTPQPEQGEETAPADSGAPNALATAQPEVQEGPFSALFPDFSWTSTPIQILAAVIFGLILLRTRRLRRKELERRRNLTRRKPR